MVRGFMLGACLCAFASASPAVLRCDPVGPNHLSCFDSETGERTEVDQLPNGGIEARTRPGYERESGGVDYFRAQAPRRKRFSEHLEDARRRNDYRY